ncbi:MAG TPA: nucleotide exchange factor GrpE, partial [Candidatus Angelobacter sp.]|nr:nucleotide exchange factor GrpE [Candidatus Angelobacter sp.]
MSKGNGRADAGLDDKLNDEHLKDEKLREEKLKAEQLKDRPLKDGRLKDEHEGQVLEHELPVADPADGFEEKNASAVDSQATAGTGAESELQKLRAERTDLFDRLARLQAEFDNYRKRAAKENADFRDFAVSDAARALLPVIDS